MSLVTEKFLLDIYQNQLICTVSQLMIYSAELQMNLAERLKNYNKKGSVMNQTRKETTRS